MNIGILIPGFSADEHDWCIPIYLNFVHRLAERESVRVFALRYPSRRHPYSIYRATVIPLDGGSFTAGIGRLRLWLRTLLAVRDQHRRTPFDVLHAIWADETGLLARWAGRLLHIPSVVSIAGGELAGLPDINYGLQLSRFSRWIVRQALQANRVMAPCVYAADLARTIARREPIISRLGIDLDLFRPAPRSEPASTKKIIAVGSISAVKDQAAALRVFAHVRTAATLTIVGDQHNGPLLDQLRATATQLGIAKRVQFQAAVDHGQLPALYQAADLHLLTSRHEAFGMVTAESAACAVPTIGLARGILPELAAAGGGIVVSEQDAAPTIDRLLADSSHLATMGHAARQFAEDQLSLDEMITGVQAIYRQVAS